MAPLADVIVVVTVFALMAFVVATGVWVLTRGPEREATEECETCGRPTTEPHVLTSAPRRRVASGAVGYSSISATFCAEHCPGGCDAAHPDAA